MEACRAHNPEVVGSKPTLAIRLLSSVRQSMRLLIAGPRVRAPQEASKIPYSCNTHKPDLLSVSSVPTGSACCDPIFENGQRLAR